MADSNSAIENLNLSNCNLSSYILIELAQVIHKSQSLSSIYLFGNPGSSDSFVLKYFERMFASEKDASSLKAAETDFKILLSKSTVQKRKFSLMYQQNLIQ